MRENFDKAISILFALEGYESNHASDPGGYTKYGISQRYNPDIDIKNLTKEKAKEIYLERYWLPLGCDERPYPWDVLIFVQGVNIGGKVKAFYSDKSTIAEFLMLNLKHYVTRPHKSKFLAGWCNRLIELHRLITR